MVRNIGNKCLGLGLGLVAATTMMSGCTNYDLSFKTPGNGEKTTIQAPKNDLAKKLPQNWDNIVNAPIAQEIRYDNGNSTRRVTSVIGDELELKKSLENICSEQEEGGGMYGDIFGGSFTEPIITVDYVRHEEEGGDSNSFVIAYNQDYCNSNPIVLGWFDYQRDVPLKKPDYVGLNFPESSLEEIIINGTFSINNFQNISPNRKGPSLLSGDGGTSASYEKMVENIGGFGDILVEGNFAYVQRE